MEQRGDSTSWLRAQRFVRSLPTDWWQAQTASCAACGVEWWLDEDPTARCSIEPGRDEDVGCYRGQCPACGQHITLLWWPSEMAPTEILYRRRKESATQA